MGSAKDDQTKPARKVSAGGTAATKNSATSNVGEALRAVYRDAVAEDVPNEMLDLLNKLG